jgi:pilus assembly protein CpaE
LADADGPFRLGVLNAGLECSAEDCVTFAELAARLAKAPADLVLVSLGADPAPGWTTIEYAASHTKAPVLAVGPAGDPQQVVGALRAGAREYLDAGRWREELPGVLDKLRQANAVAYRRGRVVGVVAAAPGSGVTVVSTNLAFALADKHPRQVALAEVLTGVPELALDLDLQPRHTVADLVEQGERIDAIMMRQALVEHPAGVSVLAYQPEALQATPLKPTVMRQTLILLRSLFDFVILDLGHQADAGCLEALRLADEVLVVVRLDVPSLRLSRQFLRYLLDAGLPLEKLRVVANRSGQRGQIAAKKVEETLGRPILEWIPDDAGTVNDAHNQGKPLVGTARRASITRQFDKLASQVSARKA